MRTRKMERSSKTGLPPEVDNCNLARTRPSPKKASGVADVVTGRGVAMGIRAGTYVATIAEVQVNRRTGAVHVQRFVCAHDCGLIINPDGLRGVISANLVQSMSRALKEEVRFNSSNVTSVDWVSYPVARASDIPNQVDIILINHPEKPAGGAGEPSSRPTAAAIANAIFDATGARVRQAPLTPPRTDAAHTTGNRSRLKSARNAATEVNCPGHKATVLVAFAWIGATPIDSIAGNEINEPPPAIAFITPAISEATTSQM